MSELLAEKDRRTNRRRLDHRPWELGNVVVAGTVSLNERREALVNKVAVSTLWGDLSREASGPTVPRPALSEQ